MLKFILIVILFVIVFILWRSIAKKKINTIYDAQRKGLSELICDETEDELPEKSKAIKKILDIERNKNVEVAEQHQILKDTETKQQISVEQAVTEHDQKLFDDVAVLFFEKAIQIKDFNHAERIQHEFLSKMPMSTQSHCGLLDRGDWSIFWSYHEQSLEYYVGCYGVFYTHVDRLGVEHKAEFKTTP